MVRVPRNWAEKPHTFRLLLQHFPAFIAGFRPMPTGPYAKGYGLGLTEERHEVPSHPVLMRALPRSRFTGLFVEQAELPVGQAETLEEFEAELRATGFVKPGQVLVQSFARPNKFRVKVDKFPVDGHDYNPSVKGPGSSSPEKPLDEVPSPLHALRGPVKAGERQRALTGVQRMEHDLMRQIVQSKSPKGGA